MYSYLDENIELTTIEPEYSAMFCEGKQEVTFFYNNEIDSASFAHDLDDAESLFEDWCQLEREK